MIRAAPNPMTPRQMVRAVGGGGERGHRRRDAEHHETDAQDQGAAEPVPERAADEQEAGEHQDVGVDDPLQLRRRGVEVAHQGRQRDVQDQAVDRGDQHRQAHDGQCPMPPAIRHRHKLRRDDTVTPPTSAVASVHAGVAPWRSTSIAGPAASVRSGRRGGARTRSHAGACGSWRSARGRDRPRPSPRSPRSRARRRGVQSLNRQPSTSSSMSGNAAATASSLASVPRLRRPGMSTSEPPEGSGTSWRDVVVWRPR